MLPRDLLKADTGLAFVVSFVLYGLFDRRQVHARRVSSVNTVSTLAYESLQFSMLFVFVFLTLKHVTETLLAAQSREVRPR
jgi:hypothetical protein